MSREWGREAFAPADAAPVGFVPQGLPGVQAVALDRDLLADAMRTRRGGFSADRPRDFVPANGFVAGGVAAFGGSAPAAAATEPSTHADATAARIVAIEDPAPAAAEPIDTQLIFDAGIAEGERRMAARAAADAEACARLLSTVGGGARFDRPGLARRLRDTVLHLVGQLVGEHGISPERLGSRVDEAVRLLADVTEPARLSLHPDDAAMMQGRLAPNMAVLVDPTIERGGFRLETLSATVEDGPTLWIDQLAAALDRVAVPGEQ